jgi:tetratricopeptide (TPR) repeat protein
MVTLAKHGRIILAAMITCVPAVVLTQTAGPLTITTSSKEALALYERAREYVENVENESAQPLLDDAIQKDPTFAMAYALRANAAVGFEAARQHRAKALGMAKQVSAGERHLMMAQQASAEGDIPQVKQHLAELLKLHPTDKHVLYFAGNLARAFDDTQALQYFTQASKIDPAFAAPYNQIGYVHISKGDYAAAEHALKGDHAKARETYLRSSAQARTATDRANAHLWTAVTFIHEGKPSEALAALDQQRTIADKDGLLPAAMGTHIDAASILSEGGKTAEARTQLDQAWTMSEASQVPARTKRNVQRQIVMARALVAAQAKDFTAAHAEAAKAKTMITPELPPAVTQAYQGMLGVIAVRQGNAKLALQHFKAADPEDVFTMFYTAEAMRMVGDTAGAAALYKKIANWNLNSVPYALVRVKATKALGT